MGIFDSWEEVDLTAPQIGTRAKTAQVDMYGNYVSDVEAAAQNQAQARAQQQDLAAMLAASARGEGPSVAEMQLQRTLDQNQRAAAGQIGSIRGMSPALAQRLITNQQAAQSQEAAGQGALLRAQEMMANRALYGNMLSGMRGQDQGQYGQASAGGLNKAQLESQNINYAQGLQANIDVANANLKQQEQQMRQQQRAADEKARADMLAGIANAGASAVMAGATGGASLIPQAIAGSIKKYDGGTITGKEGLPTDHPARDTVPALLSPGEIVLPRSVAQSPDAPKKAAEFVAKEKGVEFDPAELMADMDILSRRVAELQKKKQSR